MKTIKPFSMLNLLAAGLFVSNIHAVPAPAYLRELDITIKAPTAEETTTTFNKLNKKTLVALKSLKRGGYIYTKDENGKKSATTIITRGAADFLAFTYITPLETQFYAIKASKNQAIIWLKSPAMEGKMLSVKDDLSEIILEKFNKEDKSQQWEMVCGDGLNQVYFKNVLTGLYLGVNEEGLLECQADKSSKSELFKVMVLD